MINSRLMKRWRPWLAVTVMTLLVLSVFPRVALAEPAGTEATPQSAPSFSDVGKNHLNYTYIEYMTKKGLISGFPDGTYRPGEGLTRAQAAVVISKAAGLDISAEAANPFNDLENNHWALPYITAAAGAGYITGFPDGSFRADEQLTRAQGITLVMNLCTQQERVSLPAMTDMDNSHWAASAMGTSLAMNMIGTSPDGSNIYPEAIMNRGSLARSVAILLTNDPGRYETVLNGTLGNIKGAITLTRNGETRTLKAGDSIAVRTGDLINTGSGQGRIIYPDGSGIMLKSNTSLTIQTAKGRSYIKTDGSPGTAVDDLTVKLDEGALVGALATFIQEEESLAGNTANKRLAALDTFDLWAAKDSGSQPWYKSAQTKKEKVKVDMAWGVAAIRGSIFSASASADSCTMSLLDGEGSFTNSAGAAVSLNPGQSSNITSPEEAPTAPAPFDETVQELWSDPEVQNTLVEMAETMDANQPQSQESSPVQETNQVQQVITTLQNQNIPVTTTNPNVSVPAPAQQTTTTGTSSSGGSGRPSSPQNQAAPEGLGGVAPTNAANDDGKITGVSTEMEYKLSTSSNYTACTGTEITGLVAGDYLVRYKEKAGFNAGADATVTVLAYVAPTPTSPSALLSSIALSEGTLSPAFDSATYTYSATVDNATEQVTVTAEAVSGSAEVSMSINDGNANSGSSQPIDLNEGANTVKIVVTNGAAPDTVTATYELTIIRTPDPSTTLKSIILSAGTTMFPNFDPDEKNYIVNVESDVSQVNIIANTTADKATIAFNEKKSFAERGTTSVTITVENENNPSTSYTLTINWGSGWMELAGLNAETDEDWDGDMTMAFKSDGNPAVAYLDSSPGEVALKEYKEELVGEDIVRSWTPPSSPTITANEIALAANSNGQLSLAYIDASGPSVWENIYSSSGLIRGYNASLSTPYAKLQHKLINDVPIIVFTGKDTVSQQVYGSVLTYSTGSEGSLVPEGGYFCDGSVQALDVTGFYYYLKQENHYYIAYIDFANNLHVVKKDANICNDIGTFSQVNHTGGVSLGIYEDKPVVAYMAGSSIQVKQYDAESQQTPGWNTLGSPGVTATTGPVKLFVDTSGLYLCYADAEGYFKVMKYKNSSWNTLTPTGPAAPQSVGSKFDFAVSRDTLYVLYQGTDDKLHVMRFMLPTS